MAVLNTGSGTAARNGTTTHTISFGFTPATGSLLVFVVAGSVTSTESGAGGWTQRLSPVDSAELSVFTKTCAGDTSITLTHNASDYPVAWYAEEWPTGSTWHSGTSESATDITFPTLSSLPGTEIQLGAAYAVGNATSGSTGSTWTAGTEVWTERADVSVAPTTTDGVYFTVATAPSCRVSSTTPAGSFPINTPGATAPNSQKVIWAIVDAGVTVTKIAENSSTANASSYADAESTQPTANRGLLIAVVNQAAGASPTSVTGYGVTWTKLNEVGATLRASLWTAYSGTSPTSTAVTVAYGAGQTACIFFVYQLANVDTTDFTVQQPTGSGTGTTATVTFSALGAADNVEFMAVGTGSTGDMTVDATGGWIELGESNQGSPVTRHMNQMRTGADLTATVTWTGSAAWAAVGAELKLAVVAGTTVTPATVAVIAAVDSPVVIAAAVLVPAVVTVTVAIDTPTVGAPGLVTPAEVVAVVAVPTPTILGAALVTPATVTAVVAIDTPTVAGAALVTPAEVAVIAALGTPTIDVSGAGLVTPAAVAVTVTLDTPTVLGAALVAPAMVTLVATLDTVTISAGASVAPAEVVVTAALPLPTIDVTAGGAVSPAALAVTVGIDTPTITVAGLVAPDTVAVITALPLPTIDVSGGAVVTPATVAVSLALDTPTVAGGATVTPATAAVVVSLPTPTAAVATTVTPATVTALATLSTPSYTAGGLVAVATVTVTVDVPTPGLEAEVAVDFYYEGGTTLGAHEGGALVGAGSGGALLAAVAGLSAVLVGATESTADLLETEVGYELPVTTGLMVWLDAAQLDLADGAAVSPWPDLSGGGRDGIIVGTPAPVVRTDALNGLPVVRFTVNEGRVRGNSGLVAADLGYYKHTLVYVTRLWGPNVGRSFAGTYPAVNFLVGFHTTGQDIMYDNGWVGTVQAWAPHPGPWKLYGSDSHHTGSAYLVRLFKDGVVLGSATNGAGLGAGYNLSGYDTTGTPETMDCEVAELVLYNRKLADPERQQVESYLVDKWGL